MDWTVVKDWLIDHGYANENWDYIEVTDSSIYLKDDNENTYISAFQAHGNLIVFVGSVKPKISVGGDTGFACNSPWDAIDYFIEYMEDLWDDLGKKYGGNKYDYC